MRTDTTKLQLTDILDDKYTNTYIEPLLIKQRIAEVIEEHKNFTKNSTRELAQELWSSIAESNYIKHHFTMSDMDILTDAIKYSLMQSTTNKEKFLEEVMEVINKIEIEWKYKYGITDDGVDTLPNKNPIYDVTIKDILQYAVKHRDYYKNKSKDDEIAQGNLNQYIAAANGQKYAIARIKGIDFYQEHLPDISYADFSYSIIEDCYLSNYMENEGKKISNLNLSHSLIINSQFEFNKLEGISFESATIVNSLFQVNDYADNVSFKGIRTEGSTSFDVANDEREALNLYLSARFENFSDKEKRAYLNAQYRSAICSGVIAASALSAISIFFISNTVSIFIIPAFALLGGALGKWSVKKSLSNEKGIVEGEIGERLALSGTKHKLAAAYFLNQATALKHSFIAISFGSIVSFYELLNNSTLGSIVENSILASAIVYGFSCMLGAYNKYKKDIRALKSKLLKKSNSGEKALEIIYANNKATEIISSVKDKLKGIQEFTSILFETLRPSADKLFSTLTIASIAIATFPYIEATLSAKAYLTAGIGSVVYLLYDPLIKCLDKRNRPKLNQVKAQITVDGDTYEKKAKELS